MCRWLTNVNMIVSFAFWFVHVMSEGRRGGGGDEAVMEEVTVTDCVPGVDLRS